MAPWGVSLLTKPMPQNSDQPVCSKQYSCLFAHLTLNSTQKLGDVYNSNPVWCFQVTLSFKKNHKNPHISAPCHTPQNPLWKSFSQLAKLSYIWKLVFSRVNTGNGNLPSSNVGDTKFTHSPFPALNTKQFYHCNIHTTSSLKCKLPHHWADESVSALSCSHLTGHQPLQKQI